MTQLDIDAAVAARDAVHFLPLGGAGEIGLNLNLYVHAGRWLMVDFGIGFADDRTPGVDILLPDPEFILERQDQLLGLVITHAHEDHLGAVAYMWDEFEVPIYATPFTAAVLRAKLRDAGKSEVKIITVDYGGQIEIGPFQIEFVGLTHSIPEPSAMVLHTPVGRIVHSGDYKLDPAPIIGPVANADRLRQLGDEGVLAAVSDSTNIFENGMSGSEQSVREHFLELFGQFHQRIAVACFATNVARLHSIATAAAAHDRQVALVGRSLWRINGAARETGYLADLPPFLSPEDVDYLPREKVVMICTGSQGEPRSALWRIARNDHPDVSLDPGDTVIFSSREIPGNESSIGELQNALTMRGVDIITADDGPVHVSGHPCREEVVQFYQWLRPQVVIPVHGEQRHLREHAKLAGACQVKQSLVPRDGALIRIDGTGVREVGEVHAGRLALDGNQLIPLDGQALRTRRRIMASGFAVITVVLDKAGRLVAPPQFSIPGLFEDADDWAEIEADLVRDVEISLAEVPQRARKDDGVIRDAARSAARRFVRQEVGKKPVINVHVVRV